MLHAPAFPGECEEATAVSRLVIASIDRNAQIMTIQQSADATVTDEKDVARLVSGQHVFDLANDTRLGVNRPLPAPNANLRAGKELIGDSLKLARHQEA